MPSKGDNVRPKGGSSYLDDDTDMNTTELIRHWSMSGAGRDIAGRFHPGAEIRETIAARSHDDEPIPELANVLVKRADEDDWTPLALG